MLDVTQPKSGPSRRHKATKLTETSTKTLYTPIFYGSPKAGSSAGNLPSISEPTLKRLQELSRMHVALAQSVPEVPASRRGSPACATVSPSPPSVSCGKQKTREVESDHELVPEVLADLRAGTEHSVAQNPRVGHLRKRIIEALEDCGYDPSHGKWAMVSSLLKIGVISGGTKWLGARTDLLPVDISPLLHAGASGLGWCNAETEEEWLQWEKKFDEEMRLRSKVEKWKQGVVASVPVPRDLDVTVDAPVPRNSATARVPPPKTMTIMRPKSTTQDVLPPHRSTVNRLSLLQEDPLKDASPLGFSMAKRTAAARAAASKPLPRNKQPSDKSRGLLQNNSQPKRDCEELKSRPSTDARRISDSRTSDLSFQPLSFPSSQLVTSTPKAHNDKLGANIPPLTSSHAVSTPLPKNSTVTRFSSSSSVLRTYGRTRSSLTKSMTVPEVSSHKALGKRKIERTSTEDEGSLKVKKPRIESSAGGGGDNGPSTWGADESFDMPQRQIESTVSLWPGAGLVAEQKEPPTTPLPPQPVAKFVDLLASAKKDKIMRKKKRAEAKRKSMGVSKNGDLTGGSVDPSVTAEKHLAESAVASRPRSQDRTEREEPLLRVSNLPSQLDEVSPPSPPATPKQLAPSPSAAMEAQVPEQAPAALPATPERRQGPAPSATSLIQRLSPPKQVPSLFLTPRSVKDTEAGSPMHLTVPNGKDSLGDGPGSPTRARVLVGGSPLRESALHSSPREDVVRPREGDDEVGHLNLVVEEQHCDGHLGPRRQLDIDLDELDINLEPRHPLDLELEHPQEVNLDNPIYGDLPPSSPVPLDNEKQSNPFLQSQHHADAYVDLDAQEAEHVDIVVPLRDHSLEPSSNVFKSKKSRRKDDDDVYTFDSDSDSGSVYAIDAASDVDLSSPGKSLSSLAGSDDDDDDSDFGDRHELPVVGGKKPGLNEFELDGEFDPPFVSTQQPACNDVFPAKSSFGTPMFGLEPQLAGGGVHTPGRSKASQALLGPSHGTPMKFPSSSGYGYSSQIDVRARVEEVDRLLEKDVDFEGWLKDLSTGDDS